MPMGGLLVIEYVFHVTLISVGTILAYFSGSWCAGASPRSLTKKGCG
jgi:hypothetical protein